MKLAFVCPRYGENVIGGAEQLCKQLAERFVNELNINVDIITTCAEDYVTWKNVYSEGISIINNVNINRFKTDFERTLTFHILYQKILGSNPAEFEKEKYEIITNILKTPEQIQERWMVCQGPYSSGLFEYLKNNHQCYFLIFFFTYLYPTTYYGIQIAPEKSILIPAAHDEPAIYFPILNKVFTTPKVIIYLTEEERKFVISKFHNQTIINKIIGTGIDFPDAVDPCEFKKKYGVDNFIVYVGRIDEFKGCHELFQFYIRYKADTKSNIKLVLLGKSAMNIPKHPDIIYLGFLSDSDKFNAIAAAKLLVMPSKYESLSIVLLEAWLCLTPVLVNGECDVLKGQCKRANGGLWYTNYNEFKEVLTYLLMNDPIRDKLGVNGKRYVTENYSWDVIERKYCEIFERLKKRDCYKSIVF
jgi:glycosyltransferase involved in cell wall biosynthesis